MEYKDRAVLAGKQYEYRVTAVGAGGVSDFSETSGSLRARPLKGCFLRDVSVKRLCYENETESCRLELNCYTQCWFRQLTLFSDMSAHVFVMSLSPSLNCVRNLRVDREILVITW